ncbi:hypothetical protein LSM04_002009 [Trypanosoma melophagium]|uniref:uncharacterized protein n=1 Tax=Trypanosoma melophagium TaxID=715481 RepID=UPI00351A197B|nr:hypothetical protein LSM04_002009 [Trypanosoma melophagium]
MNELFSTLESSLSKRIEELDTRIDMCASECRKLSELTVKNSSCEEDSNETVAKPLMDSQSMHMSELSERLQKLETTVNTMVSQTDSKPATEKYDERTALLTKEVEGAATLLEGVIARQASASSDKLILDTVQLDECVSRLETQVQVMQEHVNDIMDKVQETPKVVFGNNEENMPGSAVKVTANAANDNDNDAVSANKPDDKGKYNRNTNNGESETGKQTAITESHWQQDRIHRHLQEELELASADLHTQVIERLGMT